ncbi:MAG: hypothetical protein H8D47_03095 [Planctomycetes bacterium]|nr:hypothetical protein [Planctomycetota bacterium]MBL7106544.1 hypothetical protein [Phycisphaerae bacterium]
MTLKKEQLTVFPDTNILLHYPPFDQIDWLEWCNCKSIKIILCLQVVDELDSKKDDPSLGERAKKVIKKIKELISQNGGNIKDNIVLEMHSKDLNNANISADETIIQQIMDYKSSHNNKEICIMSEDLGMQIRCRDRVEAIEPDKRQRLSDPSSELQKENIQLKNTIQKIKNSVPELSLRFCDNDDYSHKQYILCQPSEIRSEKIAKALEKLRKKYSTNFLQNAETNRIPIFKLSQIEESEYERYDKEIENFFANIEQYFHKRHGFINTFHRTISLELEIRNIGGKPAEDVDLLIHFPNGFKMYTEKDRPCSPVKPMPPKKPRTQLEMMKTRMGCNFNQILPSYNFSHIGNEPSFILKKTNSYDFTDHFYRIKHGNLVKLPEIFFEFETYESAASFSFDYELSPANLPDKKKNTLHVVIEKNNKGSVH